MTQSCAPSAQVVDIHNPTGLLLYEIAGAGLYVIPHQYRMFS